MVSYGNQAGTLFGVGEAFCSAIPTRQAVFIPSQLHESNVSFTVIQRQFTQPEPS